MEKEGDVRKANNFFQDYINQLDATHFITFSSSGPSVLRRLLKREGSLKGFTITHFPWGDEVAHPPEGITAFSKDAYESFANKLKACFEVST